MDLLKAYIDFNIIKEGHFKLTSDRHAKTYIDKDKIFRSPVFFDTIFQLSLLCEKLVLPKQFVLTGPAVAGAVLAALVWAYIRFQQPRSQYCLQNNISFVYPEKINGLMTFRRGHDLYLKGKTVILVEDIITTGKSILQTADAVDACGGRVYGAVCIWNRSAWATGRFETLSLINKPLDSWLPSQCPLCGKIPLTNPKE